MPDIITMVSRREMTSRGELACTVVSEPSWPVFMACSMSSASPPRHSPTMIRSGRMRSALRTRSRMVIAPRPSMLGGRASSRIRCGWPSRSSAASSMVTIRSPAGMKSLRTLSSVVLPEPVPPETMRFFRICTQTLRNAAISAVQVPKRMRSASVSGTRENLRIVTHGPVSESGGMMALTREPSGRRAST